MSGPKVTYHAEVVYEYDEDETDNVTSPVTVRLSVPKYPVVTDLTAEKSSGKVVMAWSEPNITDPIATEVTEVIIGNKQTEECCQVFGTGMSFV